MEIARLIQRKDSLTNWESANPILEEGEIGYVTDNGLIKIGDGVKNFNALTYYKPPIEWTDISDAPDIPTVNDGRLTFYRNGETLGQFSSNSKNNVNIEIPVYRSSNNTINVDNKNNNLTFKYNEKEFTLDRDYGLCINIEYLASVLKQFM